ncbi:TetR family transcriptional regulator [Actinoplanes sp. NEAU-A12]|uniref:TetR family transcriptional regulator n=1 Tax=Actinoplanes sandaracinus TaxID=3045177 RepID=A0ABT6WQ14_9ACTN|nr:TetR/AcrR family transcriptional regulator [Actinoplanes sandaracinus]MDI6101774.1 TetR family transcriptional regulator [Actinoplanes sandaracinus]
MTARETATPPRRRDAAKTRQLLLDAALQRFTRDGYAATTVRDIADDAGVNVALISRYFKSKEGLFEACLTSSVDEIRRNAEDTPLGRTPEAIARQIARPRTEGLLNHLVLLLRSSGDEGADRIRLGLLRSYGERLAEATGSPPGDDRMLLRAQVVLAAATGIALLRTKSGLEPLASATEEDLVPPLRDLIDALLRDR